MRNRVVKGILALIHRERCVETCIHVYARVVAVFVFTGSTSWSLIVFRYQLAALRDLVSVRGQLTNGRRRIMHKSKVSALSA